MTTLHGWGALFDCPSPSPYVMKADIQMQMLGVEYDYAIADLDAVTKHKAPYVNDGGQVIQDSIFIRSHFENKFSKDLDAGLSASERSSAWALERLVEGHLADMMITERWLNDDNFNKGPIVFFMGVPEEAREQVITEAREGTRMGLQGKGFGRHSLSECMDLAQRDLDAVAGQLGDKPYLFGDKITGADAGVAGMLIAAGTPFFDGQLSGAIAAHDNLTAYAGRIRASYLDHNKWPAPAGM